MKKQLMFFCLCTLMTAGLYAQNSVVKLNPFGLLLGQLNAGYEHVINEKSSVEGGLSYFSVKADLDGVADTKFTGFGAYAMYRLYFAKALDAPRGLYVAPRATYGSTGNSDADANVSTFSIGAIFGNQWVWPKDGDAGFALDLAIGAAYFNANADDNITSFGLDGILPVFRLAIGYGF